MNNSQACVYLNKCPRVGRGESQTFPSSAMPMWYHLLFPAWMFGDPHITTLDDASYTFNGLGDFLLVRARDGNSSFLLQGRTAQTGSAQATNFIAFAAQYNSSRLDPIIVSEAGALDIPAPLSGTFSWKSRPRRRMRRRKGRGQEGGRMPPASVV